MNAETDKSKATPDNQGASDSAEPSPPAESAQYQSVIQRVTDELDSAANSLDSATRSKLELARRRALQSTTRAATQAATQGQQNAEVDTGSRYAATARRDGVAGASGGFWSRVHSIMPRSNPATVPVWQGFAATLGVATLAILVVLPASQQSQPNRPVTTTDSTVIDTATVQLTTVDESTTYEDINILVAADDIDFYESIDFLLWLEQNPG